MKFTIEISPTPYSRPRFGKSKQVFDTPKYSAFKTAIKFATHKVIGGKQNIFVGAIKIRLKFYKNSKKLTSRSWGDLDNHVKAILDGLNGVAFLDDSQIVELFAEKIFSEQERIEIEIENGE